MIIAKKNRKRNCFQISNHRTLKRIVVQVLILMFFIIRISAHAQPFETLIFNEHFDTNSFQNEGWTIQSKSLKTWQTKELVINPFSTIDNTSTSSAVCDWSSDAQEEWLVSPMINLSDFKEISLLFYIGINTKWASKTPLTVFVRNDANTAWQLADSVWFSTQMPSTNNVWLWKEVELDISKFIKSTSVQIALRYKGNSGDLIAIDNFRVYNAFRFTKANITAFSVPNQTKATEINIDTKALDIEVKLDTDLSAVMPSITFDGSSISPAHLQPQQFTVGVPQTYTVTALNPVYKNDWKVTLHYLDYEANIIDFKLTEQVLPAVISVTNKTVVITVKYGTDLTKISPQITVSDGATYKFATGEAGVFQDGRQVLYQVSAFNTSIAPVVWKVTVKVQKVKDGTDILSFSLPSQVNPAVINKEQKTVRIEVSCDTQLDTITPKIVVSDEAIITPISEGQFVDGEPFIYQVKASNPDIAVVNWNVIVAKQDYLTKITTFDLPIEIQDIDIDTINHIIRIAVDNAALLSNIAPVIGISPCASVEPASGIVQNFEVGKPFYYTVSAANPAVDAVRWEIQFSIAILKQRFDNEVFPPEGWTLEKFNTDKTWQKNIFGANPFSTINRSNVYSAVCPWSTTEQNEWLISNELNTSGLTNLTLVFWAAFSKSYTDNSPLQVKVITADGTKHTMWQASASMQSSNTPQWLRVELNLSQFVGQTIRLAWVLAGSNGNSVAIDDVLLSEISATSVPENDLESAVFIYPNPANTHIRIDVPAVMQKNITIEIVGIDGKQHFSQKFAHFTNQSIDILNFENGIYVLTIRTERESVSRRIVIVK